MEIEIKQKLSQIKSGIPVMPDRSCHMTTDFLECAGLVGEVIVSRGFEAKELVCKQNSCVFVINDNELGKYDIKCQYVIGEHKGAEIKKLKQEIEYANIYSEVSIGPEVYTYFYYEGRPDNFPEETKILTNIMYNKTIGKPLEDNFDELSKVSNMYVQFIIMEKYSTGWVEFLFSDKQESQPEANTTTTVVHKICELIEKRVDYGIYCYNLNFYINIPVDPASTSGPEVRMTEFGDNFYTNCVYNNINTNMYNNTPDFTYVDMFCVSLEVLVFIIISVMCVVETRLQNFFLNMCDGFLNTRLHKFLMTDNWEKNITKYTTDAIETKIDLNSNSDYESDSVNMTPEMNYKFIIIKFIKGYKDTREQKQELLYLVLESLKKLRNYLQSKPTISVKKTYAETIKTPQTVDIKSITDKTESSTSKTKVTKTRSIIPKLIIASGVVGLTSFVIYKAVKSMSAQKSRRVTRYMNPLRAKKKSRNG